MSYRPTANLRLCSAVGCVVLASLALRARVLAQTTASGLFLTNAAQVLALSPEGAERGLPTRIEGVVTCYDPGLALFVQDQTAGVFLYTTAERLAIKAGQSVRVTGVTRPGRYSPIIETTSVETIDANLKVKPILTCLGRMSQGGLDAQYVEVSGVVRIQQLMQGRLRLELAEPPHRASVWIPAPNGYERLGLPGSRVRVRAVAGVSCASSDKPCALQLFANSLEDIEVLAPGLPAFSTPQKLIAALKGYQSRSQPHARACVRAVVTLRRPSGEVFLQDASGAIRVVPQAGSTEPEPGIMVEADGYLGSVDEPPVLEAAVLRPLNEAAEPGRARVSPAEALAKHRYELVCLEAVFLSSAFAAPTNGSLQLQADGRPLSARIERFDPGASVSKLRRGDRLELSGVCEEGPLGLELLLRSAEDITILARGPAPSAWTLRSAVVGALATIVGLAAALILVQKHRRQTERTLLLQASMQAEMRENETQLRRALEERERMARDIHDEVIQSIYAVGLGLEDCRRQVRQASAGLETPIAGAIQQLNQTIRTLRGFIAGLEPKVLSGGEMKAALKSLALTSGEGSTQFRIQVEPDAADRLSPVRATQLLHIAKEAMANSLRHGHPANILLSVRAMGGGAQLEITDDGAGFDPATVANQGHGLQNMRARAQEIGAKFQIHSSCGRGCSILVTVPAPGTHHAN